MHNGDQLKCLSRLACPVLQRLEQEAFNWAKAQQLRGYLAALKEVLIAKHGEIQTGSPADHWLSWAHQHADRLDPLIREPSQ
ncbi:MAG: hypothetical protein KF751_00900 [Nitrospira sp.]|nr:hypothetical protein [Nitrospira sp.]